MDIVHNEERQRFEVNLGGETAMLEYELADDVITLRHTEVPALAEGEGVGSALVRHALEYARGEGLTVVPRCPFVKHFIQEHPEYASLVG
ncbi:MAG TPA: GNAT family N-acetyltransferase [Longimicrobiales bacterium]|nr:GNAT family N-acetyltransferase [Longimicrobiales bacterium]